MNRRMCMGIPSYIDLHFSVVSYGTACMPAGKVAEVGISILLFARFCLNDEDIDL